MSIEKSTLPSRDSTKALGTLVLRPLTLHLTLPQDLPFVDVHGNEEIRKIRAFAVQCMHGATGGRGRGGGGGGAGARGG